MADVVEQDLSVDDGEARERREPHRKCAVTREVLPKQQLIRFVADPMGHIVPDLKARLPGRGVWVTAQKEHVESAEKRKVFGRLLKQQVTVEPGLAERVELLLRERTLGAAALANKAGVIVMGFSKVEAAIADGSVALLIVASDGAQDSLRKLMQVVKRTYGESDSFAVFRIFESAELDLAFGRTNVIHAALMRSGKSGDGGFLANAERLQQYIGARVDETGSHEEI
ncbi:MAG: RNA-binding protein [Rhizobiales bacterium]|nr:RNA-binding protein [Hyphomicrobiales bacterium]